MVKLAEAPTSNIVPAAQVDLWAGIEASSQDFSINLRRIFILGPPGGGKTTASMTISEYFGELPAKTPTILKDTFYLLFDKGGFDTVKAFGYNAPHKDLSTLNPNTDNVGLAVREAIQVAKLGVQTHGIKNIVVDTVSAYDNLLVAYGRNSIDDAKNKFAVWNYVLGEHTNFLHSLSSLDANVLMLFHGKKNSWDTMAPDKQAEMKAKKLGTMSEVAEVELEVSGQARDLYRKHNSTTLVCMRDPLEKKKAVHKFYPRGRNGIEGKSRFWMLDDEEPADLKHILAKIKNAQPK